MNETVTWTAVAISGITTFSGIMLGILGMLNNRDKLRYDTKLALLEQAHATCLEHHKEAEEANADLRRQLQALDRKVST